jgi:undecaprenyl-phosphate 4-deoxy-4-formamido-L-arabinose transferase
MLNQPKSLVTSSFFVARQYIIKEILNYKNSFPYVGGLILRATHNITHVPIRQKDRLAGQSGYTFKKLLALWMNGFTAFSVKPLRVATFLGSIISALGLLSTVIIIIRKYFVPTIPAGWSSTISVILLIGGAILLELGIIGEYIGRIYLSLNNAPQYVVRDVLNINSKKE